MVSWDPQPRREVRSRVAAVIIPSPRDHSRESVARVCRHLTPRASCDGRALDLRAMWCCFGTGGRCSLTKYAHATAAQRACPPSVACRVAFSTSLADLVATWHRLLAGRAVSTGRSHRNRSRGDSISGPRPHDRGRRGRALPLLSLQLSLLQSPWLVVASFKRVNRDRALSAEW